SGLGGDCAPVVPTIPPSSQPGSCHASSAYLPGQSAHPLEAWFGFRFPGPQPLPVAATVRQARALEARQAQCLTVAPGNSHFRERAPFSLLTGQTREPEFRGSATKQQLVSLPCRTSWPLGPPALRLGGAFGAAMVVLHVKRGDESQFLLQAPGSTELEELTIQVTRVYNGRLKVQRLCTEVEELAEHGVFLPPNMQGLTEEQVQELKLKDEWGEKCVPSGGSVFKKDDIGRRNGQGSLWGSHTETCWVFIDFCLVHFQKQVEAGVFVTMEMVKDALDQLRGAVMIVYPMGLPPYDPIRMEFENKEDLSGTQAALEVIQEPEAQLWWAAKELRRTKKLSDYVGRNEKTKIIVKIQQVCEQRLLLYKLC
ncbi:Cilia- and flagella-associated protein 298, partial [Lemmus lemmus]